MTEGIGNACCNGENRYPFLLSEMKNSTNEMKRLENSGALPMGTLRLSLCVEYAIVICPYNRFRVRK